MFRIPPKENRTLIPIGVEQASAGPLMPSEEALSPDTCFDYGGENPLPPARIAHPDQLVNRIIEYANKVRFFPGESRDPNAWFTIMCATLEGAANFSENGHTYLTEAKIAQRAILDAISKERLN